MVDKNSRKSETSSNPKTIKFTKEDILAIEKAKDLLKNIKKKYDVSYDSILEKELQLPVEIFNEKLTPLQSIVKYLKENQNLSLHEIGNILSRDEKNIWHIYDKAKKIIGENFSIKLSKNNIPISIFRDEKLSSQEALISYMRDELFLSYHQIGELLHRHSRTIWTVYQRARVKYGK